MSKSTNWLACYKPNPNARLRLFCFPFAGGGASIYRVWANQLPSTIEVCPIQLPGRETRMVEKPYHQINELIESVATGLSSYFDLPFLFFGHSMGALICFELARYLRRKQLPLPLHLFLSARRAPQLSNQEVELHQLNNKEFKERLHEYNGTPKEILDNAEIMEFLLPLLRADFQLIETYQYYDEAPLAIGISTFSSLEDRFALPEMVAAWAEQTTNRFISRVVPGNHFFINTARNELLQAIQQDIEAVIKSDREKKN